jgi:beta-galactosidase/beta-glucuronidase
VQVYKSQPQNHQVVKTTRYIFNDAYVENTTVQRNTEHQLKWVLKYDIVNYEDGVEVDRQTVVKNQYGEWLVDASVNGGYISFNKNGLLKIGPRPTGGAFTYAANDKVGVAEWDFYLTVEFGQTVDGHLIENMPYQTVPLWFGPWQVGTKKVYGLYVTLTIKN